MQVEAEIESPAQPARASLEQRSARRWPAIGSPIERFNEDNEPAARPPPQKMIATWLVSNFDAGVPDGLTVIAACERFRLLGRAEQAFTSNGGGKEVHFYLVGYLLPRWGQGRAGNQDVKSRIAGLWSRYGVRLPHHVKGIYTLIVIDQGTLHIIGDHFGFRRGLMWRQGGKVVLSDSLAAIRTTIALQPDFEAVAAHTLLHHYPEGATFARGVEVLPPAAHCRFADTLTVERYWNFDQLLNRPRISTTQQEVGEALVDILAGYLAHLQPAGIHLTLTGGMDSRIVLAASLRNGVRPATYTFGEPASTDVVIARRIAHQLGLEHVNTRPDRLTSEWYAELAWRIAADGNGLSHIHRAHRLDSLLRQQWATAGDQLLLLGTMGGEAVRGAHLNDLIVTEFVRRSWEAKSSRRQLKNEIFARYFLREACVDGGRLDAMIEALPFLGEDLKRNEFHAMFDLMAALHHSQDIGLYSKTVDYVVPLFTDIDYLELLFSTRYSMLHRRNMSKNQLHRLDIPEFGCTVISHLNQALARIPLGTGHTPEDYLRSRLLYILKKGIKKRLFARPPANFSYGPWFRRFVEQQLSEALQEDSWVGELFDLERALRAVQANDHRADELYWHRFSNVVLHRMLEKTYAS